MIESVLFISMKWGSNGYSNSKRMNDFEYLIDGACLALPGMSSFLAEFIVIITSQKSLVMRKRLITLVHGNWNNHIHSHLFIIYLTPDVLWIQAF